MRCGKASLISLILPLFKAKTLAKRFQGAMAYKEVPRSYGMLTMQGWQPQESKQPDRRRGRA